LRVEGFGFRVQVSGFRVQGSGFRVQGLWVYGMGIGFRVTARRIASKRESLSNL
jgi:hypothetical protein